MANKKSSPEKQKKRYAFQFSLTSLLLLGIGFIFVLAWVFALGIMVGTGFLPGTMEGWSFFKKTAVSDEQGSKATHVPLIKEEDLTFYNQLIDKESKAKSRPAPQPPSRSEGKPLARIKDTQKKTVKGGRYHVQVAALKDKEKTEQMVERLLQAGYPAYYYKALVNGEAYYRVRCGPFTTADQVKNIAARLVEKEGFKPFIVYPDTE